jgi:large repetitive protein
MHFFFNPKNPLIPMKKVASCFFLLAVSYTSLAQLTIEKVNNTNCENPNGSLSVSVGGVTEGYSFEWKNETSMSISTNAAVSGLSAGTYSVTATNNSDQTTLSGNIYLADELTLPIISVQSVPNTTCDVMLANGTLLVTVTNGQAVDHAVQWYTGPNAEALIAGGTNPILTNLMEGSYSVAVKNMVSGCITLANAAITNASSDPVFSINSLANTNCADSPNGSLSANIGVPAQYIFQWYAGGDTFGELLGTGTSLSQIGQGIYTLKVIEINTGCASVLSGEVLEDCSQPMVEVVSNTNCTIPNGSASASVSGVTSGYSFEWFEGTDTTGPGVFGNAVSTGLAAGSYTVRITNESDASVIGTQQFTITDNLVYPEVTLLSSANTNCSVGQNNGSLNVTLHNGVVDNHSFAWYEGESPSENVISTSSNLTEARSGDYTLKVTNITSSCSTLQHGLIADNLHVPVVTINGVHNTNCNSPNGTLTANTEGPANGYIFEWYEGTAGSGNIIGNNQTMNDLSPGTYSVKVIDATTACAVLLAADVNDARINPTITIESTPNTDCNGTNPNGAAHIVINNGDASDHHSFAWYSGENTEGEVVATSSALSELGAGIFTAKVTNLLTGCFSVAGVVITDVPNIPEVTITTINNTTCGDVPNGQLTANTTEPSSHYAIIWNEGQDRFGEIIGNGPTMTNLAPGFYTVEVSYITTGCSAELTALVGDECTITVSESLANPEKDRLISFYPNPVTTTLSILSKANGVISLIDIKGMIILTKNISASTDLLMLDLSGVISGKYVLRVTDGVRMRNYHVVVQK